MVVANTLVHAKGKDLDAIEQTVSEIKKNNKINPFTQNGNIVLVNITSGAIL